MHLACDTACRCCCCGCSDIAPIDMIDQIHLLCAYIYIHATTAGKTVKCEEHTHRYHTNPLERMHDASTAAARACRNPPPESVSCACIYDIYICYVPIYDRSYTLCAYIYTRVLAGVLLVSAMVDFSSTTTLVDSIYHSICPP